jgi:hypothetical protein
LHPHRHAPPHALDDPNQIGLALPGRHAVHDAHDAVVGLELDLEHERLAAIAAACGPYAAFRGEQPATVTLVAEQRRETGSGIEAGQAEPVDRAICADQGRGLRVADEGVIL